MRVAGLCRSGSLLEARPPLVDKGRKRARTNPNWCGPCSWRPSCLKRNHPSPRRPRVNPPNARRGNPLAGASGWDQLPRKTRLRASARRNGRLQPDRRRWIGIKKRREQTQLTASATTRPEHQETAARTPDFADRTHSRHRSRTCPPHDRDERSQSAHATQTCLAISL